MHRKTLCPLFSRHIEISTTDYVTVGKKKKKKKNQAHGETAMATNSINIWHQVAESNNSYQIKIFDF